MLASVLPSVSERFTLNCSDIFRLGFLNVCKYNAVNPYAVLLLILLVSDCSNLCSNPVVVNWLILSVKELERELELVVLKVGFICR